MMISKHDLSAFSFPLLRDSRTFKMTLQSQIWWWVLCGPGISKWLNAIFWWAGEPSFIFKELCNNFLHTKKAEDKLGCCCQLFKCGCVRKSACKKATECGIVELLVVATTYGQRDCLCREIWLGFFIRKTMSRILEGKTKGFDRETRCLVCVVW